MARILLIEDDDNEAADLSRLLEEKGYTVFLVNKGKDGIRRTRQENFDIIIIGLPLPDIKAEEILRRLNKTRHSEKRNVIVLSARDEIEIIETCLERGADDYLIKPIRPSYLLNKIEEYLFKKKLGGHNKRIAFSG